MTRMVSTHLEIRATPNGDRIACRACGHALGPAGEGWKRHAILHARSMNGVGGKAYSGAPEAMLRTFCCPGCGKLLDTEMALPDEPFLNDIVRA